MLIRILIIIGLLLNGCSSLKHKKKIRRNVWQKPNEIISAMNISPESTICDVGSGKGYFTFKFARVAKQVIAVDIKKESLDRIDSQKWANIKTVLGTENDPKLKDNTCDVIFMSLTYHHIDNRVAYLQKLKPSLKKNGRFFNLDNVADIKAYENSLKRLPAKQCRFPREKFLQEAKAAGFHHQKSHQILKFQYLEELTVN